MSELRSRELSREQHVKQSENIDEDQLVPLLRQGDRRAFEALVHAYQHRVFGTAYRMLGDSTEAEDVAQEVFLRVHRSVKEFRGDSKLSTWLYAITTRVCLSKLASRRPGVAEDELPDLPDERSDPSAGLEEAERDAMVQRAISALDPDRRMVVVLRDLQGLSYEEIAEALDLALGTVRSRLHRARTELRQRLVRLLST